MEQNEENNKIETKVVKAIGENIAKGVREQLKDNSGSEYLLKIQHEDPTQVLPIYEPVLYKANGVIDTVSRYLEKRVSLIEELDSTVIVNRDSKTIKLVANEKNHFSDKICGQLQMHPDFLKFGINSDEARTPEKLGDFLRMNRSVFLSKTIAMALVTELKSFKANVQTQIEKFSANNGDKKAVFDRTVSSNAPSAFNILIRVFKGQPAKEIEVEVVMSVNGDSIVCHLESPDAADFIETIKNDAIDAEIDKIKALAPNILIIEE